MAGFNTHITTSTIVGIGYGAAAYVFMPEIANGETVTITTCMLTAGLCSIAGILPDLDSGSGRPVKEISAFVAAMAPMLMIDRFRRFGMGPEEIALAGAIMYMVIRFGVAEVFKKYTKHRGMWHSIPAAISVALLAFLVVSSERLDVRLLKASAVFLGFMVHLILDEIWSVEWHGITPHFKKSFGTAIKFWNPNSMWSNISTYSKLAVLIMAAVGDPLLMQHYHLHPTPEETPTANPTPAIATEPLTFPITR
ncbi:metal-dependent hydrolase [Blastopirellula sp. JC732]|uniref:Metal-dependent hydrolase n=1 Tax=Blastopirellula sediminis TaxID=2894196 RepID=A0A9X1MRR8_9BACT|nr:metal-dependent hydrolase [Blastopirellula sediminis]MCC9605139.1 metal-dependent hydrolase [Blastopirellula sediminis]MCC9631561.1 metal-dependent hydrolase [Blastopirellula sediminis]